MYNRDYGRLGRIGLVTPQANPTAEPEVRHLLPAGVSMLTTRCTSAGPPRERFVNYFRQLDQSLATFDTLRLDAIGFACTASSYLVDASEEAEKLAALEAETSCPVITAATAIHQALQFLGAQSIALACPYPQWLYELALGYWQNRGYRVEASLSVQPGMGDTRAIYELSGAATGRKLLEAFNGVEADALVITGTGMPGLQAMLDMQQATGKPVMNSNLCLAWACLTAADIPFNDRAPSPGLPLLGGWQENIQNL